MLACLVAGIFTFMESGSNGVLLDSFQCLYQCCGGGTGPPLQPHVHHVHNAVLLLALVVLFNFLDFLRVETEFEGKFAPIFELLQHSNVVCQQ